MIIFYGGNRRGWKDLKCLKESDSLIINYSESAIKASEKIRKFIKENNRLGRTIAGYFSYDFSIQLLGVKKKEKDFFEVPMVYLKAYDKDQVIKYKHSKSINKGESKTVAGEFKSIISKKEYNSAYLKTINYIKEGDIYQLNLTHCLEGKSDKSGYEIFKRAVEENHASHMAYIQDPDFEVISASPEKFVKVTGRKIATEPIKGTRPRGLSWLEDRKNRLELIKSEKEEAELNMITDLLRNDIGKVSEIGSVKLEKRRNVMKLSKLWHTYSVVIGQLKKGLNSWDALLAMLPGGSITGCPKKRAVEIIEELEKTNRGLYTGCIGYIEPNGDMEFSIAIRTVIKRGKKIYLQVGGGIVIDSEKGAEFEETLQKSKGFSKII